MKIVKTIVDNLKVKIDCDLEEIIEILPKDLTGADFSQFFQILTKDSIEVLKLQIDEFIKDN